MKKFFLKVFIAVFIINIFTVACSKTEKFTIGKSSNKAKSGNEEKRQNGNARKQADMVGKIKSIVGNEITISIVDMPKMDKSNVDEEQKDSKKGQMQQGGPGMMPMPEGKDESGEDNLKLTGEVKTFTIPVGLPIMSTKRGTDGIEKTELSLEDIYEGMVLQVWLKEGGKGEEKTAESVSVFSTSK